MSLGIVARSQHIAIHVLLACNLMPYWHVPGFALMPYWHFAAFPLINSINCVNTSLVMLLASYVTPRLSLKGAYLHQPVPFLRRFRILLRHFRYVLRLLRFVLRISALCIFGTFAAFPHNFGVLLAPSSPLGF